MTILPDDRLVPIDDMATRRELWHGVWDWLIRESERLASAAEQTGDRLSNVAMVECPKCRQWRDPSHEANCPC
jgi:hypothetical protein